MEERFSVAEQAFVEGIQNPVVFFDMFVSEIHPDVQAARDYQVPVLLDESRTAVMKAGRGVGKTLDLESDIMKYIHEHPREEGLLCTPNLAHIEPLWTRLTNFFMGDLYWRTFIKRCVKNPYTLEAANGFTLHGRISGTTGGMGFLGLHVGAVWVDEAAYFMSDGMEQLQGCMKKNCRIRLMGCPSGIKKSYLSIAYDDPKIPQTSKYKITRYQDPTFTKEEEERLIRIYGSKNSQSFLNMVMAEEGMSSKKTFEPMHYNKCFLKLAKYEVFEFNGKDCQESEIDIKTLDWPLIPKEYVEINVTADLGFSPDPTVIGVWGTDDKGTDFLLAKVKLYSITYTRQAELLDAIAKHFAAKNVAIDVGGPGQTVYLDLSNKDRFPIMPYQPLAVDFRANIVLGYKDVIDEKTGRVESVAIVENAKSHSTVLVEGGFENKTLILPSQDLELYDEIDMNTKHKNSRGGYSYSGIDHHIDMIRCKMLIKFLSGDRIITDDGGDMVGLTDF